MYAHCVLRGFILFSCEKEMEQHQRRDILAKDILLRSHGFEAKRLPQELKKQQRTRVQVFKKEARKKARNRPEEKEMVKEVSKELEVWFNLVPKAILNEANLS